MLSLSNKHAVVFGVASETSLAWAIARSMSHAGARVSLGYQQRFKSRVQQLVRSGDAQIDQCVRCDVTQPDEVAALFDCLPNPVDIVVHSVAYANPETFGQPVRDLASQDFTTAMIASCYSLIPVVRHALPKMTRGGSVIAMSYLGGQRVVANYRAMGIAKAALEATVRELAVDLGPMGVRVNAISAGPIKTLASSQVTGFDDMLSVYQKVAPLRRSVSQTDVANLALFLASDLGSGITAQTIFVDAGYSALAMAELPVESHQERSGIWQLPTSLEAAR